MTKGSWNHVRFYTKVRLSAITTNNALEKSTHLFMQNVLRLSKNKKDKSCYFFINNWVTEFLATAEWLQLDALS